MLARGYRILLLEYQLFAKDVGKVFEAEGAEVFWLSPKELTVDSFKACVKEVSPSLLFSINFSPECSYLAGECGVPYVSWTVDPLPAKRCKILGDQGRQFGFHFAHRRAFVEVLTGLGLTGEFMPLAAPISRRNIEQLTPSLQLRFACPISFVGNSLRKDFFHLEARWKEKGGERKDMLWLEEIFQQRGELLHFYGIFASDIPQELISGFEDEREVSEWVEGANGWLAWRLRTQRVKAIVPMGPALYGDLGWSSFGSLYRGIVAHGDELSNLYAVSRMNLDLPRIYQRDIVTMRVFDVMALGGLVLCEKNAAVEGLFQDGEHFIAYENSTDLANVVERLQKEPEARLRVIGEQARECILKAHTMTHRVRRILEVCRLGGIK
ncbi:MAG: glycosyltransferase [Myxococcota bacterium]|nr:glycosyltransferase [Myxococcota bacterium]